MPNVNQTAESITAYCAFRMSKIDSESIGLLRTISVAVSLQDTPNPASLARLTALEQKAVLIREIQAQIAAGVDPTTITLPDGDV
jgi:hypothetical protein